MDKLMLDSTYLLPILGVRVGLERFETRFPLLIDEYKLIYNPISIMEAKRIVLKLVKKHLQKRELILKRFREGILALFSDKRLAQTIITNSDIEEIADRLLLEIGIKDYFDRLIYSTAAYFNAILLTEDKSLKVEAEDLPSPRKVIKWRELIKGLNQ